MEEGSEVIHTQAIPSVLCCLLLMPTDQDIELTLSSSRTMSANCMLPVTMIMN